MELMSISTGLGNNLADCDMAVQKVLTSLDKMIGLCFVDVKYAKRNRIINLANTATVKINKKEVLIDSSKLFHRIMALAKSENELKQCFEFELASHPPSLFKGQLMRKGSKAEMLKYFDKMCSPLPKQIIENCECVIDGGHLLHRVVWQKPATYADITSQYISYIRHHYGNQITVVFDGYQSNITKQQERLRRGVARSVEGEISLKSSVVFPQSEFLANNVNKTKFKYSMMLELRHCNRKEMQTFSLFRQQ